MTQSTAPTQDDRLGDLMAALLGDYHRHSRNAAAHLHESLLDPADAPRDGELDEDGEPVVVDHLTAAQHQAAAATEAALAQATATALAAVSTLRASQRATGPAAPAPSAG